MRKDSDFTYAPSRGKGILFLGTVCAALTAAEIYLFRYFDITKVDVQFFLRLIGLLILLVPLLFLLYRLYSLLFSYYRLERDGLHIQWGMRTEVIPLNAIEWIRSPAEMTMDVPWSVLPMPGAYLGTVNTTDRQIFEFLASDMKTMLFLGTPRCIYVISPGKPANFMIGFERILQKGALTNVRWTTTRPGNWIIEAWNNKPCRISIILSMVQLIIMYIRIGARFQVPAAPPPSAVPVPPEGHGIPGNMLTIPITASVIWVLGTLLGLWIFQQKESRRIAELIWVTVPAAILQCLAAVLLIY